MEINTIEYCCDIAVEMESDLKLFLECINTCAIALEGTASKGGVIIVGRR